MFKYHLKKGLLLFALILLVFGGSSANAEYIHPSATVVQTSYYTPKYTQFAIGEYEYNVKWQGILVGSSKVSVQMDSDLYNVTATAKSAKVIRLFYSLNHLSQSIFQSKDLKPLSFYSVQTENSKTKSREVKFNKNGDIEAKLWKKDLAKPEEEINFHSGNATFDPLSAAFLARSLAISGNEELSFDVFNGKHRFLITFKIEGKENIKVAGIKREAYKVVPTVKKLTDSEGEKRLHSATIWVSTDDKHDVLRLESKVLIGSVSAELVKFTPIMPSQDPTSRAGLR